MSSSPLPFLPQCGLSAAWRSSGSSLSAPLKLDLPGIGRLSGPPLPLPLQSSPCEHTRYSLTHCLTACGIIIGKDCGIGHVE